MSLCSCKAVFINDAVRDAHVEAMRYRNEVELKGDKKHEQGYQVHEKVTA